jgi:hypothetical protein
MAAKVAAIAAANWLLKGYFDFGPSLAEPPPV